MTTATALDRYPTPACAQTLGWRLIDADIENGKVRMGFEAKPAFCNPSGCVQGGFIAAMLDDAMGPVILIMSDGADYTVTIDMNISFLASARPGPMVAEANLVRRGKTVGFLEGRLYDADGALVAKASCSVRIVPAAKALA
jgi:uncharacterized protein (TIGR00369 family)